MIRVFRVVVLRERTEIIGSLSGNGNLMPSSFILLPYKLSAKNKKSKLAPTTKKDVELAEKMGVLILSLAKTLSFGSWVEEMITNSDEKEKIDVITLLETVSFPFDHFENLKEEFIQVAADRIGTYNVLYLKKELLHVGNEIKVSR